MGAAATIVLLRSTYRTFVVGFIGDYFSGPQVKCQVHCGVLVVGNLGGRVAHHREPAIPAGGGAYAVSASLKAHALGSGAVPLPRARTYNCVALANSSG